MRKWGDQFFGGLGVWEILKPSRTFEKVYTAEKKEHSGVVTSAFTITCSINQTNSTRKATVAFKQGEIVGGRTPRRQCGRAFGQAGGPGDTESTAGACVQTTNRQNKTKLINYELRFSLTEIPKREYLSIYPTGLYRRVIIPIFGYPSIGRIVRAGGMSDLDVTQKPRQKTIDLTPSTTHQPKWGIGMA